MHYITLRSSQLSFSRKQQENYKIQQNIFEQFLIPTNVVFQFLGTTDYHVIIAIKRIEKKSWRLTDVQPQYYYVQLVQ